MRVDLLLPIFDATLKLVTPSGKPIVGADITVGGVALGKTDASGNVLAADIPSGSFVVSASWYGQDISPTVPLTVTTSARYLLTASKIASVTIQVLSSLNQGLSQAQVMIRTGATTVFTGTTDGDGIVVVSLPFGTYDVQASYKGVEAGKTISVIGDATEKIVTGIFIELLGQPLTFAGFALWVVVILMVLSVPAFILYRRRRAPPPPPPPPPPTSRPPNPAESGSVENGSLMGALGSATGTACLILGFVFTLVGLFFLLFAMLRFTELGSLDLSPWGVAIGLLGVGVILFLASWRLSETKKTSHATRSN